MNDKKKEIGKHGENSSLETSSAIKDNELNEIVGEEG